MNEKQWDKEIAEGLEKVRHRIAQDLINEYWKERKND